MTNARTPSVRDAVTQTLPHGRFDISPMPDHGPEVLRVRCFCGRALRWVGQLPSDLLLAWLADHDDEIFLTQAQLDERAGARLDPSSLAATPSLFSPGIVAGMVAAWTREAEALEAQAVRPCLRVIDGDREV